MEGINKIVAIRTKAFTTVKNSIDIENETSLAIKLVTGTPSTIPADTPTKTLETAFGAFSLLTDAAATVKPSKHIPDEERREVSAQPIVL